MIPLLLWRCPLCGCNAALEHRRRWLRRDVLVCKHCQARWRVRRVPGDNFYLKLLAMPAGQGDGAKPHPATACDAVRRPTLRMLETTSMLSASRTAGSGEVETCGLGSINAIQNGWELSLPAWVDLMLAGLALAEISDPLLALEPGEKLYLASQQAALWGPAPVEGGQPASPGPAASFGVPLGNGRLFLTDRRLAWRGKPEALDLPLASLRSGRAVLTLGLAISDGRQLLFFQLPEESPLMWVTYLELLAPGIQAGSGQARGGQVGS